MSFQQQNLLPSLPVPELDETLVAYYKSAEPFLTEDQKKATKRAIDKFRSSKHVKDAQFALNRRANEQRNWLEEWWYDVYLDIREPIIPYLSIGSIHPRAKPMPEGFQVKRAAEVVHYLMKIWLQMRREQYPITKSRGAVWDMNQYYVLFNSNRTPQKQKDVLRRHFRLESEGPCPSHVTVICAGHLWALATLDAQGEVLSSNALYQQLKKIEKTSRSKPNPHPITCLTADNRDSWATLRAHIMKMSGENAKNMLNVEESAFCLCLTDKDWGKGDADDQLLHYSLGGDCSEYWADKTFCTQIHKDSRMTGQSDHSNTDAIAPLEAFNIATKQIKQVDWTPKDVPHPEPCHLEFEIDDQVKKAVDRVRKEFQKRSANLEVRKVESEAYGNELYRALKIYGDTIVQMALQLAFYNTHNKLAPAYETASTRKFFHARTETVRACTSEIKELVEDIIKRQNPVTDAQKTLFTKAYNTHNHLMAKACDFKGVDRHLLGIRKTIETFGKGCSPKLDTPELYLDDAWKLSGGDGNFQLSTSFVGYEEGGAFGYVAAMLTDGYGVFYKMNKDSITLVTTSYSNSKFTKLKLFGENLRWAFKKLQEFFPEQKARI
ncbi:hypothetical protein L596_019518 [Steinernema carpocapsae]|uniref:Choline/carnitine acyltransferase domain-containing protein n=1 Tax=Steinernema carpocapsae TaxID=34508 RepID=A0A4U5MR93_STECR|nr:hypothetical protein L596_019518 [Steinernema carpocapsae]